MVAYHDTEWGVPVHDDRRLFEFMVLDAFQAGLSWSVILGKRASFRRAFGGFNPRRIASFEDSDVERLVADASIVRNRQKILATISNASAFLQVQKEFGGFDEYIWQFVGGSPIRNRWQRSEDVPTYTDESERMSRALRLRGFRFVGPTICYAFMQAAGLVNDHLSDCFRHPEICALDSS
jgi:DNA-3-methyladenine glycosylase I